MFVRAEGVKKIAAFFSLGPVGRFFKDIWQISRLFCHNVVSVDRQNSCNNMLADCLRCCTWACIFWYGSYPNDIKWEKFMKFLNYNGIKFFIELNVLKQYLKGTLPGKSIRDHQYKKQLMNFILLASGLFSLIRNNLRIWWHIPVWLWIFM